MKIVLIENQLFQFRKITRLIERLIDGASVHPHDERGFAFVMDLVRIGLNPRYGKKIDDPRRAALGALEKFFKKENPDVYVIDYLLLGAHIGETGIEFALFLAGRGLLEGKSVIFLSRESEESPLVTRELVRIGKGATAKFAYEWVRKGYAGQEILQESYFNEMLKPKIMAALGLQNDSNAEPISDENVPAGMSLADYRNRLSAVINKLSSLPSGEADSAAYENIVGEVIKLCFFNSLKNVEPQVQNSGATLRRDWVASNRAEVGFWLRIRQQHNSVQVVWECKNKVKLEASDFNQMLAYMSQFGKFGILCFRGESTARKDKQIERIGKHDGGGVVLVLDDQDLTCLLRAALDGKSIEEHIETKYDAIVRRIA